MVREAGLHPAGLPGAPAGRAGRGGRLAGDKQPYQAAAAGDLSWFGDAVTKHYNGDDSDVKVLAGGVLSAYQGLTVEEHATRVNAFFADATHPTLSRPYTACGYAPMVELLRYLEANGFTNYIVSGGGRDFMRPVVAGDVRSTAGARDRQFGGLDFKDGQLLTTSRPEFFDDGPIKPVRIWGRTGRRPILAAGNSNGDIQMLQYTHGRRTVAVHAGAATTTPTGNSITSPARKRHSTGRRPRAGPSSASAMTGPPFSAISSVGPVTFDHQAVVERSTSLTRPSSWLR